MIDKDTKSFSKWFKIFFLAVFVIYLGSWFYTIHMANFQRLNKLEPVMPVANSDSAEYRDLAESMLAGKGFYQSIYADTLQSPGYPFFLAFLKTLGRSYFLVTLLQVLMVFATAVIVRRLGLVLCPEDKRRGLTVGEIAAAFFLINPIVWALALTVMTDIPFLFLFALGFYFITLSDYKHKVIVSSFVFAAAIYVRPMGVLALPIFIAPYMLSPMQLKEKIKSVLIMVVIIAVCISPWLWRNYKLTGVADFSSFKSANLSLYAVPMYLASRNNTSLEAEISNMQKLINVPPIRWRYLNDSKKVTQVSMDILMAHPFNYAIYHLTTSFSFLFSSSIQYVIETYEQAMHIQPNLSPGAMSYLASGNINLFFKNIALVWWKVAERVVWLLIYIVAAMGVWKNRREKAVWVYIFVPLYLMLLAGPLGNARYAVQSLYFKSLLFSVGVVWLIERFKNNFLLRR